MYIVVTTVIANTCIDYSPCLTAGSSSYTFNFSNMPNENILSSVNNSPGPLINRYFSKFSAASTHNSCKYLSVLSKIKVWDKFINSELAEDVLGTIPIELLLKSIEGKYSEKFNLIADQNGYGFDGRDKDINFTNRDTLYFPGLIDGKNLNIMLFAPSTYASSRGDGVDVYYYHSNSYSTNYNNGFRSNYYSLRPVITLKKDVLPLKTGDKWLIQK